VDPPPQEIRTSRKRKQEHSTSRFERKPMASPKNPPARPHQPTSGDEVTAIRRSNATLPPLAKLSQTCLESVKCPALFPP
jgi:hypothetical protein